MTNQTLKDIDRAFKALEERDELLDKIRAEIEEAKTVRVIANDATIEASADAVINPQYRNFTSGLDMAISIIDKYRKGENE